jgi:hypothetical protein
MPRAKSQMATRLNKSAPPAPIHFRTFISTMRSSFLQGERIALPGIFPLRSGLWSRTWNNPAARPDFHPGIGPSSIGGVALAVHKLWCFILISDINT